MEQSEEIRRIIDRWTSAISESDVASALGRLSQHPGTVVVGTDPAEWWHGGEIRAVATYVLHLEQGEWKVRCWSPALSVT